VSDGIGEGPQESRDGKWVYFVKRPPAESGIWKTPTAGGREEKVVGDVIFGLSYTVGKSGLYYIAGPDAAHKLMHYSLRHAKEFELLTHEQLNQNGVAVAPDENWLLYVRAIQADTDLMFVDNFR
jgi:hypothetical protein